MVVPSPQRRPIDRMVLSPIVVVKYGVSVIHQGARHPSPLSFDDLVGATNPGDVVAAKLADEFIFVWSFNANQMPTHRFAPMLCCVPGKIIPDQCVGMTFKFDAFGSAEYCWIDNALISVNRDLDFRNAVLIFGSRRCIQSSLQHDDQSPGFYLLPFFCVLVDASDRCVVAIQWLTRCRIVIFNGSGNCQAETRDQI